MRRPNQSGFAMLLVMLMAGVVAIMLYLEIPRIAFEAQRQKEQMLVDRGEQFKRAIGLFYREQRRWPSSMDELLKFQTKHYLRHKYVDPMTGKDEWRLVHIQNGMLTDSVNSTGAAGGQGQQQGFAAMGYITQQAYVTQPTGSGGGGLTRPRNRPNEGGAGSTGSGPELPPDTSGGGPPATTTPGAGGSPGNPQDPNQPGGLPNPNGPNPQFPNPAGGTGPNPAAPGVPGLPGTPGQTQPGSNDALKAINNLLMSPNPQGLRAAQANQGQVIGGGIAGVASQADGDSIMVYNDHSNYKEWEFIFDPTKWRAPPDPRGGGGGVPASSLGSTAQPSLTTAPNTSGH